MIKEKRIYIDIFLANKGWINAGVITFDVASNFSSFSYFKSYIENDYPPLNPATLNYRHTKNRHFITNNKELLDRTFWEILPNQSDWSHQVIIAHHPEYLSMNYAEKLYFLKYRVSGGLRSYIQEDGEKESIKGLDWLEQTRKESIDFYIKHIEKFPQLRSLMPLTSYGGMRPKCMFEDDHGNHWIAKFNLPNDPYNMALIERLALVLAEKSGLKVAENKIIETTNGEHIFLSKRFDRDKNNRKHSLSLFALNEAKPDSQRQIPGNPASVISFLIKRHSDFKDFDTAQIVVKLLIDIGINNTDNHLRNIRLILNNHNKWELAPAYDLIINPWNQPHVYNPAGSSMDQIFLYNEQLPELMQKELNIDANLIAEQQKKVRKTIDGWKDEADKLGLSENDKLKVEQGLSLGLKRQNINLKIKQNLQNKLKLVKPN